MSSRDVVAANREFYDALWSDARLQDPRRFNTWPLVSGFLAAAPDRLEIGPGLRPRLPIAGTHFLDISPPAIEQLNARGGIARLGEITSLPFGDEAFDLVAAFDVVEHVDDERQVFREFSRVLKDNGVIVFSVPLHARLWTEFDDRVGHARRYEPAELQAILSDHGFAIEQTAKFGMKPANPRLVNYGMDWLQRHRSWAMRWYNLVFNPIGMLLQKPLRWSPGLIDTAELDGLLLVCRRDRR